MGLKHIVGLTFITLLLIPTLLVANLAVGLDRTVLDEGFVTETLEEENAYETVIDIAETELGNQTSEAPFEPGDVLTEDFIQGEVEHNIQNFYSYLYKDTDTLNLTIDLTPVRENIADSLTDQLKGDMLQQFDPQLHQMSQSQDDFQTVRQDFRDQQHQLIQQSTSENLTQQELEQQFDDRKDTIRNQLSIADQADVPANLEEAVQKLTELKADALLDDSMTYTDFSTRLNQTIDEIGPAVTTAMLNQSADIPREIDLTERMDQNAIDQLDRARNILEPIRIGIYVLPLLALLLLGLMWKAAHTRGGAMTAAGLPIAIVGLISTGAFVLLKDTALQDLEDQIVSNAPEPAANLATGILDQIVQVFTTQSTLLLGLGILLILAAIGLALKHRLIDSSDIDTPDTDDKEDDMAKDDRDESEDDDDHGTKATGDSGETQDRVEGDGEPTDRPAR